MVPIVNAAGDVSVCSGVTLSAGLSEQDCKSRGIVFERALKIAASATRYALAPCKVAEHEVYFALRFRNDHLWQVSFAFAGANEDPKKQVAVYAAYLQQELGEPQERLPDGSGACYVYPWGRVDATYDPRGGSCGVYISWGTPQELAANA